MARKKNAKKKKKEVDRKDPCLDPTYQQIIGKSDDAAWGAVNGCYRKRKLPTCP